MYEKLMIACLIESNNFLKEEYLKFTSCEDFSKTLSALTFSVYTKLVARFADWAKETLQ
jgi:hypothetical protein